MEKHSEKEIIELAKAAYVFGYPLVLMEQSRQIATNVEQPPLRFSMDQKYVDPKKEG